MNNLMMSSYKDFELQVKTYCNPEDYEINNHELKNIANYNYQLFISVLKLGAEIISASRIVDELVKISIRTSITPEEALKMVGVFRFINNCFDMTCYTIDNKPEPSKSIWEWVKSILWT